MSICGPAADDDAAAAGGARRCASSICAMRWESVPSPALVRFDGVSSAAVCHARFFPFPTPSLLIGSISLPIALIFFDSSNPPAAPRTFDSSLLMRASGSTDPFVAAKVTSPRALASVTAISSCSARCGLCFLSALTSLSCSLRAATSANRQERASASLRPSRALPSTFLS